MFQIKSLKTLEILSTHIWENLQWFISLIFWTTMGFLSPERFVEKLGCFPVFLEPVITKIPYFVFDRVCHLGYDGIANALWVFGARKIFPIA